MPKQTGFSRHTIGNKSSTKTSSFGSLAIAATPSAPFALYPLPPCVCALPPGLSAASAVRRKHASGVCVCWLIERQSTLVQMKLCVFWLHLPPSPPPALSKAETSTNRAQYSHHKQGRGRSSEWCTSHERRVSQLVNGRTKRRPWFSNVKTQPPIARQLTPL